MPKYEDLEFLKNEILQIGNEEQVVAEREGRLNTVSLPAEEENIPEPEEAAMEELLDDDLLKDIQDDFNEGLAFDESELTGLDESGGGEELFEEDEEIFDAEEDLAELDELGIDTSLENIEELEEESILKSADLSGGEQDWDELRGDVSLDELEELEPELEEMEPELEEMEPELEEMEPELEEMEPEFEEAESEALEGLEDLSPLEMSPEEGGGELDELAGLTSLEEELPEVAGEIESEGFDDLSPLEMTPEESAGELDELAGLTSLEEELPEESAGEPFEEVVGEDDALKELMGGFEDLTVEESEAAPGEGGNLLDELLGEESPAEMGNLDDLLSDLDSGEEAGELDEGLADLAGEFSDVTPAATAEHDLGALADELADIDLSGAGEEEIGALEEESPGEELEEAPGADLGLDELSIPGLEGLEEEGEAAPEKVEGSIEDILSEIDSEGEEEAGIGDLDSFSLDNLEDLYSEEGGEEEEAGPGGELPPIGGEAEEMIEEEVGEISSPSESGEVLLTVAQRKQIIFTLSALPKEVELKLSEVIAGDKYNDEELMPLLEALIHGEKLPAIVSIYEAITGDSSLSKISAVKYTGLEFEERQKSLAYTFQKNIFPILRNIAAIFVGIAFLTFLWFRVLDPTFDANRLYGQGKKLIEENKFEESRNKFDEAYLVQPRYNELLRFAELYQEKKRFPLAEEKYLEALETRYKKSVDLQYADMLREAGRFEKAHDVYSKILEADERDIDVLLGLGRTNLDWSNEVEERLEAAMNNYLDVVEINVKNKEAVYSLLDIYIRQDNMKEALKIYNHLENVMKVSKVEPSSYAKLAGYLIDIDELDNVKDILKKAAESQGRTDNYPDLDYQFARYKRYLNVNNEERMHLDNALLKFDIMKQHEPERFYSGDYYRNILARVYNDLGENQNRVSKGDVEAMKNFIKATETDNSYGKPHHNLGNYYLYDAGKTYYDEALKSYLEAEKRGFSNDRQDYNLGWLYHHNEMFQDSYSKVKKLLTKYPDNNNLKFMMGTVLYRLGKYDLSESLLMETFGYYDGMKQIYYPLEMDTKEDRIIVEMLKKICNNLGATYQKKYEQTRDSEYLVQATKFYTDSIEYFHKSGDKPFDPDDRSGEGSLRTGYDKYISTEAMINLRMVLYPETARAEPTLYELFPFDYQDGL